MRGIIYEQMLNNVYEGVYFVDKTRKITFWNSGAERITGFKADEILGKYCYENILNHMDENGRQLCMNGCPLHETLKDEQMRITTVYLHHKDGHRLKVNVKVFPMYNDERELVGAAEVFVQSKKAFASDLTEEELKSIAYIDQLTKVPNRRATESTLNLHLDEFERDRQEFGIVFLDIDHFKYVNDNYGHNIGDEVLKMIAQTLNQAIRSIDFVGRWGGEEFVIILEGISCDSFPQILDKLLILVRESKLRLPEGNEISVTVSLGASMVRKNDTVESLISRADENMYYVKQNGRNGWKFS